MGAIVARRILHIYKVGIPAITGINTRMILPKRKSKEYDFFHYLNYHERRHFVLLFFLQGLLKALLALSPVLIATYREAVAHLNTTCTREVICSPVETAGRRPMWEVVLEVPLVNQLLDAVSPV